MQCVCPLPRDPWDPLQGQGPRGHCLSQTASTFAHGGPLFSHQWCLLANCTHTEFEGQEILESEEKTSNTASHPWRYTEPPDMVLKANANSIDPVWGSAFLSSSLVPLMQLTFGLHWSDKDLRGLHCPLCSVHTLHCSYQPHWDCGQSQLEWAANIKSAPDFQGLIGKKNAKMYLNNFLLITCWNNNILDILLG